jgi:hypothetical protein
VLKKLILNVIKFIMVIVFISFVKNCVINAFICCKIVEKICLIGKNYTAFITTMAGLNNL